MSSVNKASIVKTSKPMSVDDDSDFLFIDGEYNDNLEGVDRLHYKYTKRSASSSALGKAARERCSNYSTFIRRTKPKNRRCTSSKTTTTMPKASNGIGRRCHGRTRTRSPSRRRRLISSRKASHSGYTT